MQVLILHNHLNPGGVTRIIESQTKSLAGLPIKVLVGQASQDAKKVMPDTEIIEFPPLNYLKKRDYSDREANGLLNEILGFLESNINEETIIHVHNLNLGKNPVLTYAVYLLAKNGTPVFNHAHDFAEDRPGNYNFLKQIIEGNFKKNLMEVLYPSFTNLNFGILNSFDRDRLMDYEIPEERILWLPNPVSFQVKKILPDKKQAKKEICNQLNISEEKLLVTYPVRVIRRKNIGELLLLSVLFEDSVQFVVTQPPKNPEEIKLYRQWLNFCDELKLNVLFEVGEKVDFEELLFASDFCITTSFREGFGMVYLEPWLADTPVSGRDIGYISNDFKNDGLQFPGLYKQLKIPDLNDDFKHLDMNTQMQVIKDVRNGNIDHKSIFQLNPMLNILFKPVKKSLVEKNKSIIKEKYSLKKYGIKLQNKYLQMVK